MNLWVSNNYRINEISDCDSIEKHPVMPIKDVIMSY